MYTMYTHLNFMEKKYTIDDFVPKIEREKKTPKKRYKKSNNVVWLENLYMEHKRKEHPDLPFISPKLFKEDSANGLTDCCVWWVRLHGGQADRINNGAVWDPRKHTFRKGGTRKGIADIIGIIKGRYLAIEVKYGKDRQSVDQKLIQQEIETAGGVYMIARDFDTFVEDFQKILGDIPD